MCYWEQITFRCMHKAERRMRRCHDSRNDMFGECTSIQAVKRRWFERDYDCENCISGYTLLSSDAKQAMVENLRVAVQRKREILEQEESQSALGVNPAQGAQSAQGAQPAQGAQEQLPEPSQVEQVSKISGRSYYNRYHPY